MIGLPECIMFGIVCLVPPGIGVMIWRTWGRTGS